MDQKILGESVNDFGIPSGAVTEAGDVSVSSEPDLKSVFQGSKHGVKFTIYFSEREQAYTYDIPALKIYAGSEWFESEKDAGQDAELEIDTQGETVVGSKVVEDKPLGEASDGKFSAEVGVEHVGHPEGVPANSELAYDTQVMVSFSLEQDTRPYGIKAITPVIPDQEISFTFVESTDDEDIKHEVKLTLKDIGHEFRAGAELGSSLSIAPSVLDIDFKTMKSKLVFWVS